MNDYLKETKYLNFKDFKYDEFVSAISKNQTKKEVAVDLYFLVNKSLAIGFFLFDLISIFFTNNKFIVMKSF